MTSDHARKKAIRARMAATGESYSTAARKLAAAGDQAPAEVVIARVTSTLASPRARVAMRADWGSRWGLGRPAGRRPGSVARLATFAAKAVVKRVSPRTDLPSVREKLTGALFHPAGEGFIEPAADRYQIDFRGYAVMKVNGQHYSGAAGTPLQARHRSEEYPDAPLELRGTPCQVIAVRVGPAEFTVWIDDEHIRRLRAGAGRRAARAPGGRGRAEVRGDRYSPVEGTGHAPVPR